VGGGTVTKDGVPVDNLPQFFARPCVATFDVAANERRRARAYFALGFPVAPGWQVLGSAFARSLHSGAAAAADDAVTAGDSPDALPGSGAAGAEVAAGGVAERCVSPQATALTASAVQRSRRAMFMKAERRGSAAVPGPGRPQS